MPCFSEMRSACLTCYTPVCTCIGHERTSEHGCLCAQRDAGVVLLWKSVAEEGPGTHNLERRSQGLLGFCPGSGMFSTEGAAPETAVGKSSLCATCEGWKGEGRREMPVLQT